jgi:hypothetical protein
MGAIPASAAVAALTLSTIPSNINTYERLLIWAAQCCQSIANGQQVNAVEGVGSVPLAQVQVAVTADNADRFVVSAYIPLNRNELNSPDEKTWMAAKDVAATAPHSNLLSN